MPILIFSLNFLIEMYEAGFCQNTRWFEHSASSPILSPYF